MKRLATGVYQDHYGYRVIWRTHGHPKEKRFPADTPLHVLKEWRHTQTKRTTTPSERRGSFPRDVVRFLATRKGMTSWKSDRSHLRPWVHRFVKLSRWSITPDQIRAALDDWRVQGYSPRELRHRLGLLRRVYRTFDPGQPTPCDGIRTQKPPKTRPRSVPDRLIREVAAQLQKQELIGRLRDSKTRARFLVLGTTGQRPAQLRRAQPADVDLEQRLWFVQPAKGDNGGLVYLNDDMLAAWQLFIAAKAWGRYSGRSFAKTLRRNGWPRGVWPYIARHTVGLRLSELGVDLGDIQAHMGHANIQTTRQFYVPAILSRLKEASEKLDGRLGHDGRGLPRATATTPLKRKRKGEETGGNLDRLSRLRFARATGEPTTKRA